MPHRWYQNPYMMDPRMDDHHMERAYYHVKRAYKHMKRMMEHRRSPYRSPYDYPYDDMDESPYIDHNPYTSYGS
ncbi:hypothetical protein [Paludifilum halophilum]|uniref:Uncharacterized protein n=1 Tax=Paludifilum halophilum TaxID=1642702 RepID=A0A235B2H3_9BACL|nr:hypothetical protein [Paludifilum halophilum]OYD06159.1 hypothetical protein CHM34_17835 [Paludifilum halophilum]